ncbi:MAG: IS110 family transposase [Armatimonadetes bacterium]|nr:IS110 family transposase [Armatimonadota bacterium]
MTTVAGIDVSKKTLDICVLLEDGKKREFQVSNNEEGFAQLLVKARKCGGEHLHFCMEPSGVYHVGIAYHLVEQGCTVSLENPRRIKYHGISIGALQKTDRADARIIASYCAKNCPKPWAPASPEIRDLMLIDRRLCDVLQMVTQETNRLESGRLPDVVRESIEQIVRCLKEEEKSLRKQLVAIVESSDELTRKYNLLCTIPGIGERAAIGFLAEVGDLSSYVSAESLAASFGLNPRIRRSGTSVHGQTRISKMGNAHARSRFYMPALVAIIHNPLIKAFYERLVQRGKNKKCALVACCRKLVMIAYGVLKSGKPFRCEVSPLTI